ncbi:restriction endonuclease [Pseudorhodoplanes sp.]|uniref:restriction endonuclease n=1 Tax=Pseudorhodoplanes sp. TaxID=1934341 RepID=UPI003D09C290
MADDRSIWGIHMGLLHEDRPIKEGYIAIGWKAVGDLARLPKTRDAFKTALVSAYPDTKAGAVPVNAGMLFKFAVEMKVGDLVVYPSKPDRMVNIGRIESDYFYNDDGGGGPNQRRVTWLKSMPRTTFSQDALHEIGSAVTLFQIKNHPEEFTAALEGTPIAAADVDEEQKTSASENIEDSTVDFVLKQLKTKINSYQFEQFVAHLIECMGYHARVTPASGDGGVDIIAHKDELGFEPPIIKVQCKQVLSNIGQPEVAQLYGHVESREHGLFVSLGGYTPQARQFERSKHNLRLVTGEELVELIFNHYENFDPRYQSLLPMKRVYIPGIV